MTTVRSAEPNVTPMIDVLLVLLIIFMVASIRVHHTMDAQLFESVCENGICDGAPQIVLEVLPGPAYRINKEAVASGDLFGRLASIYVARPEKLIEVAGYPGVRYADVIDAMDVARSAGVRVVGITPPSTYLSNRR